MKRLLLLALIFLAVSCKSGNVTVAVNTSSQSFDWLLGNWHRTNEEPGKETFEHWKKLSDEQYEGFGYTLQSGDTIWQESIVLVKGIEGWTFEVTGNGESVSTVFMLTQTDKDSFICENQKNELPKVIRYFKMGDNISATISGGEVEIPFDFVRVNTQ